MRKQNINELSAFCLEPDSKKKKKNPTPPPKIPKY